MFERFVIQSLFSVAFAPKIKMRTLKTFIDVLKKGKNYSFIFSIRA